MKRFLLILFLISGLQVFAQGDLDTKLRLAQEFFLEKEYEKSITLFEEVFRKKQDQEIYLSLVNAYQAAERFDDAEKLARKQFKKYPGDPVYQVDYGYFLKMTGEERKGESVYKDAIRDLPPVANNILNLSNSFQRRNEINFAIECLKRGKRLTGDYYGYEFELGELYYQVGDITSMINEYLDLLSKNQGYIQNVQNALNTSIYADPDQKNIETLNTALLKRIQREPDQSIYAEMLIWHYLQQKDFQGAIRQSKALDKRRNENGYRFLSLGDACRSNENYDLAMECYQFIIDKGSENPNYLNARILMTETIREKIISAPYGQEDLLTLEKNYLVALDDVGSNAATVSLQRGLAEVRAFYLDKDDEAIAMMQTALTYPGMSPENKAQCKLLLADIYLSVGEIWEASLLYSQVEKDFKYEALGDEAKFKNARVYFFTGDFAWAKAQLDVLKGSTSKLISNDAMRLSLIISDNLAFDTSGQALRDYADAFLSFEQNDLDGAMRKLDSMAGIYYVHPVIDEIYFLQFRIFEKNQEYEKAAAALLKIVEDHSGEILADEAIFNLAVLYEDYLDNASKAQEYYQKLFTEYPASVYVVESRKRFRRIRGDEIN